MPAIMPCRRRGLNMADITVSWNPLTSQGDWTLGSGDLTTGNDLATAVLVSLFTDRLATVDFQPPGHDIDRRGWWADAYTSDPIGSNLWQLERGIKTSETMNTAISYARQALQWLIDDGVASLVDVIGNWQGDGSLALALQVTITEPSGNISRFKFANMWVDSGSTKAAVPPYVVPANLLGSFVLDVSRLG